MKKVIKWWKEDPILNSLCILDLVVAILALLSGSAVLWNIIALWDTDNIGITHEVFMGELFMFMICTGIWLILSLIPGVRNFRKSI